MASPGQSFRLGVDIGTSNTTAILRWPDGLCRPLLFDGSPLLPSAVYLQPDGTLLVGRDALHAARLDPARLEPTPKRRLALRLGDQELDVTAAFVALLDRARAEAVRVSASSLDQVVLTHPVDWTPAQIGGLRSAAPRAGLPAPALLPEPVAAAAYFASVLDREIPDGSALVVYDFGGGTFDASVVVPAADGYRVLAVRGIENLGGVDLDAALLDHISRQHRDTEAWRTIEYPQTPADRRHQRHLLEDVRAAKEMLSRAETATIPLPVLEQEVRVTRTEFEGLARPLLERTVQTTVDAIAGAGLAPDRVAAVLLVGGSSRIPLAADLLRRAGLEPSTMEQPETVVAEGSVRLASGATGLTRPGQPVAVPPSPRPAADPPAAPADPWHGEQPTPVIAVPAGASTAMGPAATVIQPAQPPAAMPAPPPPYPPGPYPPPAPYLPPRGRAYPGRRRRRWLPVLLSVAVLAGAAAVAAVARPDLVDRLIARPTAPSPTPPPPPYEREARPAWLPASMQQFVDDATAASIVPGPATNLGTCTYRSAGVVVVQRDTFDVSGCVVTEEVRAHQVTDAAVEAEFSVAAGCGGMWMRTGTVGYFLGVCADGSIQLHSLANDPPSDKTLLRHWVGHDPARVVVALLAQGERLTVIADGTVLGTVSDGGVTRGRVGIGGFAPHPDDRMEATITDFRAWWTPPGAVAAG